MQGIAPFNFMPQLIMFHREPVTVNILLVLTYLSKMIFNLKKHLLTAL
jgi:hypothetical protein